MIDRARPARIAALDYLRGFVVVLVVLHHSVLAYCYYGHFDTRHYLWSSAPIVDSARFLGFDLLVLFNDGFFMPLMFLVSGLFVWPSLGRKGAVDYLRDRLRRLGLPFALAVVTVIPLAYYPSFRMTGSSIDFAGFWEQTVFHGPWPSGPPWFVAVLLAFDVGAASVYSIVSRRNSVWIMPRPLACFGLLAALSALAYLPLLEIFGPGRWLALGPFAVQASRIALYAVYFFAGVAASHNGSFSLANPLQRLWARWSLLAVLLFLVLVGGAAARLTGSLVLFPLVWTLFRGVNFVLFCAAATFAMFAIFLRFAQRLTGPWDSLAANAFGIYIIHYPVVVWAQYALLDVNLSAILKAALVFSAALTLSWGSVIFLRRLPGATRIL
jgi:glucan biosynthesis protein C